MMNTIKRTAEQTAIIRAIAETLPAGQKNRLLNVANKIDFISKRTNTPPTAQQEQDAIVDRYQSAKKIVNALLSGRKVSFYDEEEFDTHQFHSRACDARKIIENQYPQYQFHADWTYDKKHPYKTYYLTF